MCFLTAKSGSKRDFIFLLLVVVVVVVVVVVLVLVVGTYSVFSFFGKAIVQISVATCSRGVIELKFSYLSHQKSDFDD